MIAINIHKKLRAGMRETDIQVQLNADKGSITIIHGPSGAGKSTFLKVIAGLMKPEQGNIVVKDEVWLNTASDINLTPQQRKAGFVFQNYALFPHMTVWQQLAFATDDKQWMEQLISIGQLKDHTDHKPEYLSGGQQQRLAILRAMANKPALLLMDEPFSALDQTTKAGLIADLKLLWDELQTTVIIVSHYPHELTDIATQQLYIGS